MKRFQYMAERTVYSGYSSAEAECSSLDFDDYPGLSIESRSMVSSEWSASCSVSGDINCYAVRSASGEHNDWRSGMSCVGASLQAVCSVSNPEGCP